MYPGLCGTALSKNRYRWSTDESECLTHGRGFQAVVPGGWAQAWYKAPELRGIPQGSVLGTQWLEWREPPPQSSPGSGRVSSSQSGKRSSLRTTGRALRKHWPRTRPICFHRSKSLKWVANSSGACTSRSTGCSVSKKANPKRLASTLSLPGTRRNRNIWLTVKKINHQIRLRNARTLACWLELSTSHAGVHSTPHCENTCSESYSIWTCSLSQLGDLPFLLQNELSIETFFLSNF